MKQELWKLSTNGSVKGYFVSRKSVDEKNPTELEYVWTEKGRLKTFRTQEKCLIFVDNLNKNLD